MPSASALNDLRPSASRALRIAISVGSSIEQCSGKPPGYRTSVFRPGWQAGHAGTMSCPAGTRMGGIRRATTLDREFFYALMQGGKNLDYEVYLKTQPLLGCQKPFDALCNKDELQFQIVHQV